MILGDKPKEYKQLGKCKGEYKGFVLGVSENAATAYNVMENYQLYGYSYKDIKEKIDLYYKKR